MVEMAGPVLEVYELEDDSGLGFVTQYQTEGVLVRATAVLSREAIVSLAETLAEFLNAEEGE